MSENCLPRSHTARFGEREQNCCGDSCFAAISPKNRLCTYYTHRGSAPFIGSNSMPLAVGLTTTSKVRSYKSQVQEERIERNTQFALTYQSVIHYHSTTGVRVFREFELFISFGSALALASLHSLFSYNNSRHRLQPSCTARRINPPLAVLVYTLKGLEGQHSLALEYSSC